MQEDAREKVKEITMLGVIINCVLVIIGSLVGLLFKKGIPERVSQTAMIGLGGCTLYIGISGTLEGKNVLILIISIVIGGILGAIIDIDGAINRLSLKVEEKFNKGGKKVPLAEGFLSATLLFCVGAMAVTGSIESGIMGDHSILISKSMLDMVAAMMMAASLGVGVTLSALSIFVYQGGIVLLASLIGPFLSEGAINEMTCAGSLLIIMIGMNLMGITKIKVADFLPAIVLAPVIYGIASMF